MVSAAAQGARGHHRASLAGRLDAHSRPVQEVGFAWGVGPTVTQDSRRKAVAIMTAREVLAGLSDQQYEEFMRVVMRGRHEMLDSVHQQVLNNCGQSSSAIVRIVCWTSDACRCFRVYFSTAFQMFAHWLQETFAFSQWL